MPSHSSSIEKAVRIEHGITYHIDPDQISLQDGEAWVDVTIEFGSRGNLESETAEVLLIKRGNDWLIDAFPFFIY